jgi:hypothetical protein
MQLFPAGAGGTGIQLNDRFSFIRSLEYLGHIEGEKQLVLLIEHGFPNAAWYASGAAAARVSVSTIQTGGTQTVWPPSGRYVGSLDPAPSPGAVLSAVAARPLAERGSLRSCGGYSATAADPGGVRAELAANLDIRRSVIRARRNTTPQGERETGAGWYPRVTPF